MTAWRSCRVGGWRVMRENKGRDQGEERRYSRVGQLQRDTKERRG